MIGKKGEKYLDKYGWWQEFTYCKMCKRFTSENVFVTCVECANDLMGGKIKL